MPKNENINSSALNETILLEDGRLLGFKEYGSYNGLPILALHGTPGSRVWFEENDTISEELGIRLITIDRPGYGLSDKKKNRSIMDFNKDINQLIAHLKLSSFSIFGVSGGGAYALAFAYSNHPGLIKTGLVASAYELINGKVPADMCKPNRIGFYLAKHFPWILRYSYRQQKHLIYNNPEAYLNSVQKHVGHLCTSDQAILKTPNTTKSLLLHLKEAFKSSAAEAVNELRLLGKDWEIDLTKIIVPVEVWHGEEDTLSPISGMRKFIESISNKNVHFIPAKGHFLDEEVDLWKRILQSLMP